MKKIHLDLFSGIGGASYAVDKVFGNENVNHIFVEINPFCQNVIQKHWPEVQIIGDIRTLTNATGEQAHTTKREGLHAKSGIRDRFPFLLTGGFPCQPFSQAGRRKGTDDDRYLWPEMFRVIKEFQPEWVIGENVAGLLTIEQGMVLKQVVIDLESEDYEVQCFVIPAVAVNAPHRRDRVWIVAHRNADGNGRTGGNEEINATKAGKQTLNELAGRHQDDSYARCEYGESRTSEGMEADTTERTARPAHDKRQGKDDSNPEREGWTGSGSKDEGRLGQSSRYGSDKGWDWNSDWIEAATRFCRLDDGLRDRLVRLPDGTKISGSKWRQEALKGLGNAWVPQVAMEILKGIKELS